MMWGLITGFLKGPIGRAFDLAEKNIEAKTDREALKADILREHMRTRASWLQAGGFWTLLLFAVPTAAHYGAVVVYSVFWCKLCAYPQTWSIAALPGVMADWQGWIILASIGGLSLLGAKR